MAGKKGAKASPTRAPITVDQLDLVAHARWACLVVNVHVGTLVATARETRGIDERVRVLIETVEAAVDEMWAKMQEVSRALR